MSMFLIVMREKRETTFIFCRQNFVSLFQTQCFVCVYIWLCERNEVKENERSLQFRLGFSVREFHARIREMIMVYGDKHNKTIFI